MKPRADLHTHTVFSDGELIPAELVRRASVLGHDLLAITDHVVMTGVESTHVPPALIAQVAHDARRFGAKIVVVHGETIVEPVAPGTDRAAAENPDIDVLAHPGFITAEEADIARENGVALEISGRSGHSFTNGHVCSIARASKCMMVVDSDTHQPENLMDDEAATKIALGAGLTAEEADKALHKTPYKIAEGL